MNRLQKKCLFAAAGTHLLVVVVVICSGFVAPRSPVDQTELVSMVSPDTIEALLNSGPKNPTPAPTPIVTPPTSTPPEPPTPTPVVTPPQPPEPVTPPDRTEPDLTPVKVPDKPAKPKSKPSQLDFTPVHLNDADNAAAQRAAQAAQRKREQQQKAFNAAVNAISRGASSKTEVDMPNNNGALSANYASIVRSIYYQAWRPSTAASQDETVKVRITIASNGSVISSRIIEKSGDRDMDASVQAALDRVNFVQPFLEGMTEKEWTRVLAFSPESKNSSE